MATGRLFNRRRAGVAAAALLVAGALAAVAGIAAARAQADIAAAIEAEGVEAATMVVLRRSDGRRWIHDPDRASRRYSPASTSKIPHTLIALETGAVRADRVFEWDGKKRWSAAWNRDLTLSEAFAVSAVWVYQRLATEMGAETMARWIARFDFGDGDTGGAEDLTTYWLQGPLSISADEQAAFLTRLVDEALPVSAATYATARSIMAAGRGPGWTLFAKTGWGLRDGAPGHRLVCRLGRARRGRICLRLQYGYGKRRRRAEKARRGFGRLARHRRA